jgi:hypothetical protein
MDGSKRKNINKSLLSLPRGRLLTSPWLRDHEISAKLAWYYAQTGWLEHVADGVYKLPNDQLSWASVVNAVQQVQSVHLGGKTALQVLGRSHYAMMSFDKQFLQLFTSKNVKLPKWTESSNIKCQLKLFCTNMFGASLKGVGVLMHSHEGVEVRVSSPEMAALEVCYLVSKAVTFGEAVLLIESQSRLRPELVQQLLEHCSSIKAKRLFLYLSEEFNHPWLEDLNYKKFDLGRGNRVIAGGGHYNAKYKLSVPKIGEPNE